ncbi:MAG: uroporphyrinogen-III synthase [Ferruginibacter sp.]
MAEIKVLSTRPLAREIVEAAFSKGIDLAIKPFIKTVPIENVEVQQEIEHALSLVTSVVFTSMNAVEAVAEFILEELPAWKIYCIGNTTKQLVEKYFGVKSIAGFADNAVLLAETIVADEPAELTFFCGNQRRDELPDILRSNEIEVDEIVVYETIPLPQKVNGDYHGILFFSPSAVQSFFSVNNINDATVLFAIGSTTENEIKKFSSNKVIISDEPGKENLAEKMIEYFT